MNVEKPSISVTERRIGFFVFPAFQILDLTGPLAAFEVAARLVPNTYRLAVLSKTGGQVASSGGVVVATTEPGSDALDTLVVVGGAEVPSGHVAEVDAIRTLAATARRVTSVCTGAFLLAAAGMMGGRRATTHWRYAARLQRTYPEMKVESDRIFVRDGTVWTSAGISAGIDLAFALIEDDLGAAVMKAVAREMVIPCRRAGGQSQFSEMLALDPATDRIRATLSYARDNLTRSLTVERLAAVACLSPRQFARTFRSETGETPARAIERLRAEAAKPRVESGSEPIEIVAASVGFTDPERMRRAFVRRFGYPPQSVRRMARGSGSAATALAKDVVTG